MTSRELSKMREAMILANNYAMTFAHTDDGGSCNFDHPIIRINRLTKKQAEFKLAEMIVEKRSRSRRRRQTKKGKYL